MADGTIIPGLGMLEDLPWTVLKLATWMSVGVFLGYVPSDYQ